MTSKNKQPIPFEKSFASHACIKFWSNKNDLDPKNVPISSHSFYIFECSCGHEIVKSPNGIKKNLGCPYCSIPQQKRCKGKECAHCLKTSFFPHEKSQYWSPKNEMNPEDVSGSSHTLSPSFLQSMIRNINSFIYYFSFDEFFGRFIIPCKYYMI
jgi:hypothetical protein